MTTIITSFSYHSHWLNDNGQNVVVHFYEEKTSPYLFSYKMEGDAENLIAVLGTFALKNREGECILDELPKFVQEDFNNRLENKKINGFHQISSMSSFHKNLYFLEKKWD